MTLNTLSMTESEFSPHTDIIVCEEWRPVSGFEGYYEVSDWGRVRSVKRISTQMNAWGKLMDRNLKSIMLVPKITKKGYREVHFRKKNKVSHLRVCRLVSASFIENSENKPTVNHKNGIKIDDRLENLEWMTFSENQAHSFTNGRKHSGGFKARPVIAKKKRRGNILLLFLCRKKGRIPPR